MHDLHGKSAILTGASGGLGPHLARHLGQAGVRLLLTDLAGPGLDQLHAELGREGLMVSMRAGNLRENAARQALVEAAYTQFGGVDLLIHNAGVEYSAMYHELPEARILEVLEVNLAAVLLLTRSVLPGMLARGHGHIVSLSSLAGKSGAACQEPYAATKAALVAFTLSLRCTYRNSGISASVVCPGFCEAGIYPRIRRLAGRPAPLFLGVCSPDQVARAVIRCIVNDLPEVIVNRWPIRPLLGLSALWPRLGLWLSAKLGVNAFFQAAARSSQRPATAATAPSPEKRL